MRTLVLDSSLPEIEALLAHRKKTGIDRFDEVWEGVLHLAPATNLRHAEISAQLQALLSQPSQDRGLKLLMSPFNLGLSKDDYRIPDGGMFQPEAEGVWIPTAEAVIEVVSPGDESWEKLPFFASRGVNEVVIVDPARRRVDWLSLRDGEYVPAERSGLIEFGPAELSARLKWA